MCALHVKVHYVRTVVDMARVPLVSHFFTHRLQLLRAHPPHHQPHMGVAWQPPALLVPDFPWALCPPRGGRQAIASSIMVSMLVDQQKHKHRPSVHVADG